MWYLVWKPKDKYDVVIYGNYQGAQKFAKSGKAKITKYASQDLATCAAIDAGMTYKIIKGFKNDSYTTGKNYRKRNKDNARSKQSLNSKEYYNYLKSKDWAARRLERMKIDKFRCQMCGSKHNLNVHHLTYDRLGCEKMTDLLTLCKYCHKRVHESMGTL